MLSYRHAYHAGNIGDALKHPLLCLLIRALQRKDKPLFFLDTHAGTGLYDLDAEPAQKNKEFMHGAVRLWRARPSTPLLQDYLSCLRELNLNSDTHLRYYPGSPQIVRHLLRPGDRMLLREQNRKDIQALQHTFGNDRCVTIEQGDGYQALRAHLPPREKRGLVLIDPSYEDPDEFDRLVEQIVLAHKRWPGGIYAIWYPLLARYPIARFLRQIRDTGIPKVFRAELAALPLDNPVGLNGSGLLIVNTPFQIDTQVQELVPWLWRTICPSQQGSYRCAWLVPEQTPEPPGSAGLEPLDDNA
jgi:23S rRNA (adenine2030-N6)-methyltransferase